MSTRPLPDRLRGDAGETGLRDDRVTHRPEGTRSPWPISATVNALSGVNPRLTAGRPRGHRVTEPRRAFSLKEPRTMRSARPAPGVRRDGSQPRPRITSEVPERF